MKTVAIIGLVCAIFTFLTGIEISPHFDTLENAAFICVNACVTLSGALPFVAWLNKVLQKPLQKFSAKTGMTEAGVTGFLLSCANNMAMFATMSNMKEREKVLNVAFAVCAAFVIGDHLAFTMALAPQILLPVIVGKLAAGLFAVIFAVFLAKKMDI